MSLVSRAQSSQDLHKACKPQLRSEDSPYSPGAARVGWALNCFLNLFLNRSCLYTHIRVLTRFHSVTCIHSRLLPTYVLISHTHTHSHNTCTHLTRSPANTDLNSLSRRRSSPFHSYPPRHSLYNTELPLMHTHTLSLVHTHTGLVLTATRLPPSCCHQDARPKVSGPRDTSIYGAPLGRVRVVVRALSDCLGV